MWLRGAGAVLWVAASFGLGRCLATPYRARIEALDQWRTFLARLRLEVGFHNRPLFPALRRAAREAPIQVVVERFIDEIGTGEQEAADRAVKADIRLGAEEGAILAGMLRELARVFARPEAAVEAAARELERIVEEVREPNRKRARLVETLSGLAGITIALILL